MHYRKILCKTIRAIHIYKSVCGVQLNKELY